MFNPVFSDDGLRRVDYPDKDRQRRTIRRGNAIYTESDAEYSARMAKLDAEEREEAARLHAVHDDVRADEREIATAERLSDGQYEISVGYIVTVGNNAVTDPYGNYLFPMSDSIRTIEDLTAAVCGMGGYEE